MSEDNSESETITVSGMTCNGCERIIEDELRESGATEVSADHTSGEVEVAGLSVRNVVAALEQLGYTVEQ